MSVAVLGPHLLYKSGKNLFGSQACTTCKSNSATASPGRSLRSAPPPWIMQWGPALPFSRNSPISNTSSTPVILSIKSTELSHRTGLENFTQRSWNVWQWNKLYCNLTIYGWLLLSVQNIAVLQSKNNANGSMYN